MKNINFNEITMAADTIRCEDTVEGWRIGCFITLRGRIADSRYNGAEKKCRRRVQYFRDPEIFVPCEVLKNVKVTKATFFNLRLKSLLFGIN